VGWRKTKMNANDLVNVLSGTTTRRGFLAETMGVVTAPFFATDNLLADVPLVQEHIVARADRPNGNKRIYPLSVLQRVVADSADAVAHRQMIGQLGMPADSIIHFSQASHIVRSLKLSDFGPQIGWQLIAEIELLATPCGVILKKLLASPGQVAFRTAGVGHGKINDDGILVIDDSYKLVGVHAVPAKDAVWI
jgi:hypothetical protein